MAKERLAQRIYVRVEEEETETPFLIAGVELETVSDGLEDGKVVQVAEYERVRFLKVRRGTFEVK